MAQGYLVSAVQFSKHFTIYFIEEAALQQWKVQFSKIEPMEDTDPPWCILVHILVKIVVKFFVHIVVHVLVYILARRRMQPREREQLQKKTFVAQLMEQMATTTKKNLLM